MTEIFHPEKGIYYPAPTDFNGQIPLLSVEMLGYIHPGKTKANSNRGPHYVFLPPQRTVKFLTAIGAA